MKIDLFRLKIRDVVENYVDNEEEGVIGYNGKLNIRPKYQREFVYHEKERNAVIDTIFKGFPLNVMYWVKNEDGNYEVLDGQQRTISFCQYATGGFSVKVNGNQKAFHNLNSEERNKFLDYELMIYICEGNDTEKLDWFRIINIGGMVLTDQELLNAVYTGTWLADAKSRFSKNNCAASNLSKDYVKATVNRQELLERALQWICKSKNVESYMSAHQHDDDANELWTYFQNVIRWIEITFPVKRPKLMKSVNWGELYNNFHNNSYNSDKLEELISKLLIQDESDVDNQVGIYHYVLSGDESKLNIRQFKDGAKRAAYERQKGLCAKCGKHFEYEEMEGDHIIPWSKGGRTKPENCQMLCRHCNRIKSDK